MACRECEIFQASALNRGYYFRWKNANIELKECERHITEVMYALREAQS